jgi:MFS family permease
MEQKIREHMDYVFERAPRTARALELKEELIANLTDRYHDLIQRGESEDAALSIVIAGIGDAEELIHGLREHEMFDPVAMQQQRQRSATLTALAVAIFVASIVFPFIFETILGWLPFGEEFGYIMMILCWAAGIGLLVYNHMSTPKYVKMQETIVEDFKEWTAKKAKRKKFRELLIGTMYIATVPLYICLGSFLGAWHPGWIVFLLPTLITMIIQMVAVHRGED